MENSSNKNKKFVYLLVVFFCVFIATNIFLLFNNKKNNPGVNSTIKENPIIPTSVPKSGFINLQNGQSESTASDPLELNLLADSNSENVTAFDTIISFDPTSFDFVKADSIDLNFRVYSYKKDNQLTLTMVKINQNDAPSIFKGESVVKLVFQPKTKGNFIFTVLPSFEEETTKFVNEKTEVIYPGVNEIKITVN